MKNFLLGAGTIFSLEMRQRVRGVAWYVLLGVFFLLLLLITAFLSLVYGGILRSESGNDTAIGGIVFSLVIYFILLLGTLVAPAMSGNAINGDRDAGTLATTQVTLVTTGQIVFGKFLAGWVTALGFFAVSIPFLIYGAIAGGLSFATIVVSGLVLILELGVISAIGVGLSGLIPRPLFSIVVTYAAISALTVGTLIAFALSGLAFTSTRTQYYFDDVNSKTQTCTGQHSYRETEPAYDQVWGLLTPNPYVIVADAVPTTLDHNGQPTNLFVDLKLGLRQIQSSQFRQESPAQACREQAGNGDSARSQVQRTLDSGTPSWPFGLVVQLLLAAAALWGAWLKTRTPAAKLSRGSRIA